ncbi:hypothetical protein JD844_003259 [Phrynosoma platyrhinos]|uniref:tRNA (cytosine(38)-C(5))-methyltransferase n=1 Tax=Phrynosoma platyrhinos TaxID=52577 RepID=A0ABQ7TCL5_PHRPL|nr:hypothetical protein JD844_003259 [Phrynosoma platyrhinos]
MSPASGIPAEIVAAVDVNTVANEVYTHNFHTTPLWSKTIEGISLKEFNKLSFDMILMSPPCQPFTRVPSWKHLLTPLILFSFSLCRIGRQGDVSDPRARSFLYILDILPRLAKLPKYLLLENVKGFETSSARDELIQTLEKCGFTYQEFLLSPTCLGIPNSRLRYFLIARLQMEPFPFHVPGKMLTEFPNRDQLDSEMPRCSAGLMEDGSLLPTKEPDSDSDSSGGHLQKRDFLFKLETEQELKRKHQQDNDLSLQMLRNFLQEDGEGLSHYLLPPKSLIRYALLLDIVTPSCRRSTCFTKGYGHYIEGTGSVLQTAEDIQLEPVFKSFESLSEEEKIMKLSLLKLRYFTPREIANLHGFPLEFGFPDKVTTKQQYRLLGNSLNIHVVAKLISLLVA